MITSFDVVADSPRSASATWPQPGTRPGLHADRGGAHHIPGRMPLQGADERVAVTAAHRYTDCGSPAWSCAAPFDAASCHGTVWCSDPRWPSSATGDFDGYADFLVEDSNGAYRVMDSTLARHTKVTALLQIAAYSDLLQQNGARIPDEGALILGDTREKSFPRLCRPRESLRNRSSTSAPRLRPAKPKPPSPASTAQPRNPVSAPADYLNCALSSVMSIAVQLTPSPHLGRHQWRFGVGFAL